MKISVVCPRISEFTFPQWPYAGPIAIRETHPDHGWQRAHVFHRWRYYGSAKTETEMHELAEINREVEFDADIFKLLLKRLAKGGEGVLRLGGGQTLALVRRSEVFRAMKSAGA